MSSVMEQTSPLQQEGKGEALACTFDHPLPDLLRLSAAQILEACRRSQAQQFTSTLQQASLRGKGFVESIPLLDSYVRHLPVGNLRRRLDVRVLEDLFLHMHDHVMSHPVWVHPVFVRMTSGDMTIEQLRRFARHYFNQVKNTRQCVALALGRFHTMLEGLDGPLQPVISELTQVVLAGLLADEYGAHGHQDAQQAIDPLAVDVGDLFDTVTHPELYRRFQRALGDDERDFDTPMLHGVADNVLVQRIVSGHPAYGELEALASVGLGMEWGVPAFFSMIMAGIIKLAHRERLRLDAPSMEIWSAHVRQDVEHAIAVMVVTAFYVDDETDVRRIENATNMLMAFRYDMMSDVYREVFGVDCANLTADRLETRHHLHDSRIVDLLASERARVGRSSVVRYHDYLRRKVDPPVAPR